MAPADGVVRAKRPERLPEVLTPEEVARVLAALLRRASGAERGAYLVAGLLDGAGIRLLERLSLRVKDLDLAAGQLTVREGKGEGPRDRAPYQRGGAARARCGGALRESGGHSYSPADAGPIASPTA
jgi:integrase